ncbi:hypothetical protein [Methanobrevibacter sp. DSM 116169]|uniref:hypothetical protein n=1 Tax=Methanobrevibacter sp. DSM 116169 TaxID=3242727 RepID=UPI0038FC65B7
MSYQKLNFKHNKIFKISFLIIIIITCIDPLVGLNISNYENELLIEELNETSILDLKQEIIPNGNTFEDIQNAIHGANEGDTIYLNNLTYIGNGNQLFLYKSVHISGSTINGNETSTLDAKELSRILVIAESANNVVISNCVFINGNFDVEGGGAILVLTNNVTIKDSEFKNNFALGGGAIYTDYTNAPYGAASDLLIYNCNFINNRAIVSGGAVGAYGNNTKIVKSNFISNSAYNDRDIGRNFAYGGAIQLGMDIPNHYAYCINSTFINNYAITLHEGAYSHGGAGCVRDGDFYIDCIFINNTADEGGALTIHADCIISNCSFINNTATKLYGGAIGTGWDYEDMELIIENSNFENNKAPIGGAIQIMGENIDINNCNFSNNLAFVNGGAIYIEGDNTEIQNSLFKENIANVNGGGAYIEGSNSKFYNNTFLSNEAIPDFEKLNDGLGGAIFINGSNVFIEENTFRLNTARNGSAIYFDKSGKKLVITNNIMSNNQAWVYLLPTTSHDIYYGEKENIEVIIHGGNNIASINRLELSNAIYNGANPNEITINNEIPVLGATDSGILYQDSREYSIDILLTITHEDGECVYNQTLISDIWGNVSIVLENLKVGKYYVNAIHYEDTYYKFITNYSVFNVYPIVDVEISKYSNKTNFNYLDIIVWEISVKNNGPNQATQVLVNEILPSGLIWIKDNSEGSYNFSNGLWNVGTLNVNESKSLKIYCIANITGIIVNSVNVSSFEYDRNLSNNFDDFTVLVNDSVDLVISKIANNSNPIFGSVIEWVLTVFNDGPDDATGVVVFDILPNGIVYLGDDSGGSYDFLSGRWFIGDLAFGESKTLKIVTLVNVTGIIVNFVNVSSLEFDRNLSNNFDDFTVLVNDSVDLVISKVANNSNPIFGSVIEWVLTVFNDGPDDATGVVVFDILPDGIVYLGDDSGGSYDSSTGKWFIGDLAFGESKTLKIVTLVNVTGIIVNSVNVSSFEYDRNLSNNFDDFTVLVNDSVDLIIEKDVNDVNPMYGNIITWILTVFNDGPDDATEVIVFDILPYGIVYLGDDSGGSYDSSTGKWLIGNLNSGDSRVLKITTLINTTGIIVNYANVSSLERDRNLSNNEDDFTILVDDSVDLVIDKSVSNVNPAFGDIVIWILTVFNDGPDDATGVAVFDILPGGIVYLSDDSGGSYDSSTGKWLIGNLNSGESKILKITTLINTTGNIVNYANVSSIENDRNLSNNHISKDVKVNKSADLELIKIASIVEIYLNDTFEYIITIYNNGPDMAENVIVRDILDSSLRFLNYSASKGIYQEGIWKIGNLENGGFAILTLSVQAIAIGNIFNEAIVSSDTHDSDLSNNEDNVIINVIVIEDKIEIINDELAFFDEENFDNILTVNIANAQDLEIISMKKTGNPIIILFLLFGLLIPFRYLKLKFIFE